MKPRTGAHKALYNILEFFRKCKKVYETVRKLILCDGDMI